VISAEKVNPQTRNLACRLISAERRGGDSADTEGHAAFRVCDKLRESLSALFGVRGVRTLFARALTLAAVEVPWLGKLEVGPGGSVVIPDARETNGPDVARGGAALVTQLLALLCTFIGDALTLRLVQQHWPNIAPTDPIQRGKK
jgi:hypothetical protein